MKSIALCLHFRRLRGTCLKVTVGRATRSTQGMESPKAPKQRSLPRNWEELQIHRCWFHNALWWCSWRMCIEVEHKHGYFQGYSGLYNFLHVPKWKFHYLSGQLTRVWWTGGSVYLCKTRPNCKVGGTSTSHCISRGRGLVVSALRSQANSLDNDAAAGTEDWLTSESNACWAIQTLDLTSTSFKNFHVNFYELESHVEC